MKQETPWNKLAVEAIVIVGSILLAFAIDAWWSERNETDQVNAVLAVLKLDLESSQRRLETIRSSHEAILADSKLIIDYGEVVKLYEN